MRRLTGLEQFAQLVSRSCWLLAKWPLNWYIPGPSMLIGLLLLSISRAMAVRLRSKSVAKIAVSDKPSL